MLIEASDGEDPARFKETELFKKCREMGIVPPDAPVDRSDSGPPETGARPDPSGRPDALSLNLAVSDMWCPACAWVLEEVLKKKPGITHVSCNFSTDRLRCEYDPVLSSPDEIIAAVDSLGYRAFLPGEDRNSEEKQRAFVRFALSAFLTANIMMLSFALYSGFFTQLSPDAVYNLSLPIFVMATVVLFYGGAAICRRAWTGLTSAAFGMETLIAVGAFSAYIYSTVNLLSGSIHLYYDTAAMLVTLTLLGKIMEGRARDTVQEDLGNFFSLKPMKVKRCSPEFPHGRYTSAEALREGDVFIVEEGEIFPADGLILEGTGPVNESSLTGEARPVQKRAGNRVRSGTRALRGTFRIRAEKVGEASTLGRMIEIMEKALGQKTPLEGKTDRILRWFVPLILALSAATGCACLLSGIGFEKSLIRSLTVMVIACPCALGIAIPVARVAGISLAGRKGILVRDFSAFEQADTIDTIVFDKTGTLTAGDWKLMEIRAIEPFTETQALSLAAALEKNSDHFIAAQITGRAEKTGSPPAPLGRVRAYRNGVSGTSGENEVRIGSRDFVAENLSEPFSAFDVDEAGGTLHSTVYMSYGGRLCGVFVFGDTLKDSAAKTVEKLGHMGYSVALVSGDGHETTRAVGDILGITDAFGGKLPNDKALFVRALQENRKRVAMVGDGVNDAPALAQADLALAVHAGGQLGKEAADATLMRGDPEQIVDCLILAKQVNRKIRQNLIFSLFYNTVSIPVAMSGLLTPIVAVIAMLLSSLSVTGNTLLFMRKHASKAPAGS